MPELIPDHRKTALLIADFYGDIMGTLLHATDRDVISNTMILQRAARDAGLLVCYSATVFRPGYVVIQKLRSEISPVWPSHRSTLNRGQLEDRWVGQRFEHFPV